MLHVSEEAKQANTPLREFIRHALQRDLGYGAIRDVLLAKGWKESEVVDAYAAEALDVAPPEGRRSGSALEAFLHLTAFTSLYLGFIYLNMLIFALLDVTLPDPYQAEMGDWLHSSIRFALSGVIVFLPLYGLFSYFIRKGVKNERLVRGGGVERWLTYLTLFALVMTGLATFMVLLYSFLEGDLTLRLFLKSFSLLLVAAAAFAHLWQETMKWMKQTDVELADSSQS